MSADLSKLRKFLIEINEQRSDFTMNPTFYVKKLIPLVKNISSPIHSRLKSLDLENINISEVESVIIDLNLFLAETSKQTGVVSEIRKPLSGLKGFGDKTLSILANFGIETYEDMLLHFPYRYECLYEGGSGEKSLMSGVFQEGRIIFTRNRKRLYRAVFVGDLGIFHGTWFNFSNKYPAGFLKTGEKYNLYGYASKSGGTPSITHPEFLDDVQTGVVRPVYSLPKNIAAKKYRDALNRVFSSYIDYLPDNLPVRIIDKYNFPDVRSAMRTIHFPNSNDLPGKLSDGSHPAVKRFIYEELFYLQMGLLLKKKTYKKEKGIQFDITKELLESVADLLPFKLTKAQRRTMAEILNEMKSPEQMNRLVQGDVGSGKTIVAFICALLAVKNGYQAAIIAPTEVLAEQHHKNLLKFLEGTEYTAALLKGSLKEKEKRETYGLIAAGVVNFVTGTHAVIQEGVTFEKLGIAIIDEQHRFGVMQRKTLIDKGHKPDILLLTATPIPRTMALTFYGDLDVSIIDELPPGRKPIKTMTYPQSQVSRVYSLVKDELEKGNKAYFVYPLIETSEKLSLKAVETAYEELAAVFGEDVTGLLHGRMKAAEKHELMDRFKNGDIKILVSTTVIEVGVDVPEATVMVVENAERFGLSQLHQLRGRVGRSQRDSYCVLVTGKEISEEGKERVKTMVSTSDGFKLSEKDLEMRGPGDFFGTRQSGLPEFRFSNIVRDVRILQKAREDAQEIIDDDPDMKKPANRILVENLKYVWRRELEFLNIG